MLITECVNLTSTPHSSITLVCTASVLMQHRKSFERFETLGICFSVLVLLEGVLHRLIYQLSTHHNAIWQMIMSVPMLCLGKSHNLLGHLTVQACSGDNAQLAGSVITNCVILLYMLAICAAGLT